MIERTYIIANWKMNKKIGDTESFLGALCNEQFPSHCVVGIAPSFTSLFVAHNLLSRSQTAHIGLYAQNMSQEQSGAFTGEVSLSMLAECGVENVIIGHSERRQLFGESDISIEKKLKTLLQHSTLHATLCVGETIEQRENGNTTTVLREQLTHALSHLSSEQLSRISIAYEPVWAIGTGKSASPQIAQESHAYIREVLVDLYNREQSDNIPLLYGGSVKSNTASDLLAMSDINGLLVGGASLVYEEFIKIIRTCGEKK